MGNKAPRKRPDPSKIVKLPNKGSEKEKLFAGKPEIHSFPYAKVRNIFFDLNVDKNDVKTLKVDFLYYKETKTFVIEPIVADIPIHSEHIVITIEEIKELLTKGIVEVDIEYFSLPYLTIDIPQLDKLLQVTFPHK